MDKENTYKFAFYCFALAGLIILFTLFTSCSPKVVVMPQAPVHPEPPAWSLAKKVTADPVPQKATDESENN